MRQAEGEIIMYSGKDMLAAVVATAGLVILLFVAIGTALGAW